VLGLEPTDNLPADWQNQLARKDELEAAKTNLRE
jgi:hypothetical protein